MSHCVVISAQSYYVKQTTIEDTSWTVLYYLCGDNKLSSSQQHHLNLIQSVGSSDEVSIAVLIDKNTDSDTRLYYLNGGELLEQSWEVESDMGDPNVLEDVISKVMSDLPSDKFYLHLSSNKGSGWQGVCYDQRGDGTMITMSEISNVLSEVTNNGQEKIDVIAVATCLGGNLEFAYEVHPFCNYYVGYADCGVSGGWPLQDSLQALVDNPSLEPELFASSIVDVFTPQDIPQYQLMTAIGALNLNNIGNVKNAMNDLAQYFINSIDQYDDVIFSALEPIRIYGEMWDIQYFIDLVQFLNQITFLDSEGELIKEDLLSFIDALVINKKSLEYDDSEGFNVYFPRSVSGFNHALRYETGILPESYQHISFAVDSLWDDFLMTFLDIEDNNPPLIPTINGPSEGKSDVSYEYTISSTDPDNDDLYYLIDWDDESVQEWQGPFSSGQSITASHKWEEQDVYTIRVKARDVNGDETEWKTLEFTVSKGKKEARSSFHTFLMGRIVDIEKNNDGDFRFLPVKLLIMILGGTTEVSLDLLDESYGGYPCCGYIKDSEFKGVIMQKFILGLWSV